MSAPSAGEANGILGRLPAEARRALTDAGRLVTLPQRRVLWDPGQSVESVYFPRSGVVSLLVVAEDGTSVEVATVGNEGMAGVPVFLSQRHRAIGRAMSQIPGQGLLVDADDFDTIVGGDRTVERLLRRYTHAVMVHVAQGAVCNRLHSVERRLARWVMEMHDRIRPDDLPVTHEFLAGMLGVRRASVTDAIAPLQAAGAISQERGRIRVVDPDQLRELTCECYGVVRRAYDELLDWVDDD